MVCGTESFFVESVFDWADDDKAIDAISNGSNNLINKKVCGKLKMILKRERII